MKGWPNLVLWAWESPQDLRFLPDGVGVAFLAAEARLEGGTVRIQGRRNPLHTRPGTPLLAVVRIEAGRGPLEAHQRTTLVQRLLDVSRQPGLRGLQIDFDATLSQRPFYADLLREVRVGLPEDQFLSMTALASWALDDRWTAALPVDERVPMCFRMGAAAADIRRALAARKSLAPEARTSLGLSTDEPWPVLRPTRRYVFHPGPWTPEAFRTLQERLR